LRGRKGLIAAVSFVPPNEPHSPKEIKACVNSDEKSAPTKENRRRFVTQNRHANFLIISSIFKTLSHCGSGQKMFSLKQNCLIFKLKF
jgi:hypothetical protein